MDPRKEVSWQGLEWRSKRTSSLLFAKAFEQSYEGGCRNVG